MTAESVAVLAMLGSVLFVAYLGLLLWCGAALLFLRARGQVTRPNLAPSYGLLGSAVAGLGVLVGAQFSPDWKTEGALGTVGAMLLVTPGIVSAILRARKTLPPTLRALALPITVGAALTAVFLGFSVPLAVQARRIMAYNNPDEGAVRAELARQPEDAGAHMSLGHIDIGHGDYAQAAPEFQTVVRLEPDNREASLLLAHALMRTGQTQGAWKIYTEIATQNDGWGRAARRYLAQHTSATTPSVPGAGRAGPSR